MNPSRDKHSALLTSLRIAASVAILAGGVGLRAQASPTTRTVKADSPGTDTAFQLKAAVEISTKTLKKQLLQDLVVEFTNAKRAEHDLEPLASNEPLQKLAEKHSLDMAKNSYFSHTSQRTDRPDIPFEERVSLEKLGYKRTGENIALQPVVKSKRITTTTSSTGETTRQVERDISTYRELATRTVDGWMKSPGHRQNILTPEFNLIGIGVAAGERDGTPYIWITQNFGQK